MMNDTSVLASPFHNCSHVNVQKDMYVCVCTVYTLHHHPHFLCPLRCSIIYDLAISVPHPVCSPVRTRAAVLLQWATYFPYSPKCRLSCLLHPAGDAVSVLACYAGSTYLEHVSSTYLEHVSTTPHPTPVCERGRVSGKTD